MANTFRIFVGCDQREPDAYDVAKFSLERRASIPVQVTPIKLDGLRARGLYRRDADPLATTEFTYSRFLTPTLAGFSGLGAVLRLRFSLSRRHRGLANTQRAEGGLLRASRLHAEGIDQDGRQGADDLSAQELVVADAVQLRASRRQSAHADLVNRESGAYLHRMQWAKTRISANFPSPGTGSKAGTRSPPRDAQRRAFHPRRPVVRRMAECRLRRPLAHGARSVLARAGPELQ